MSQLDGIGAWLERRLPELLAAHGVPGAAVAVSVGNDVVETAAGLLNQATGVEATVDSVFQIGSVTKVLTTTLAMQLVDEGVLDLDAPVRRFLPEFRISDEQAAERITVRQLMCHSSGFEGDIFTDTGKGDDCIARYLDALHDTPQLFEPGEMFSYNNAGICVLGRIIEVLRGRPFDECMSTYLFAPLGMTHAANDPYEAILHRAAVGHVERTPGGELAPTPVWAMARSNAPAGSMLAMRPRDLLGFARMHLSAGRGPDGSSVVSAESVAEMQTPQVVLPDINQGAAWGLGWELFRLRDGVVFGHDGNTIGQSAFLRLVPGADVALALFCNGGSPQPLFAEIATHVLRELAGIEPAAAPLPDPAGWSSDTARYIGTYLSSETETVVSRDGEGRVWLERTPIGKTAELDEAPYRTELLAWRGDSVLPVEAERGARAPLAFLGDDGSGRAEYLHSGRADRRVSA